MTNAAACGQVLFRTGQVLMLGGLVSYLVAMTTPHWVVRPTVNSDEIANANQTKVTERYGIFKACGQDGPFLEGGTCGPLWDHLNYVDKDTVRYIQFVMVLSGILFGVGLFLEIVQFLPIEKYRNFLAMNRVVEIFTGIAAVLLLKGMVIFAGEVKNKAERVVGQDDESTGWSFVVCLLGLGISVTSLVLTIMFRELPVPSASTKGGSWVSNM